MNVCLAINVGGQFVDSRKIVNFFFKTLFLGGIVGFIASFFINSAEYITVLSPFDAKWLLGVALFFLDMLLYLLSLHRLYFLHIYLYITTDKAFFVHFGLFSKYYFFFLFFSTWFFLQLLNYL